MNHILIVEDDTTFALMLQTWLTKKGFAITSVSGVGAARRALQDEAVDQQSTGTGLKVLNQTILLLNAQNTVPITFQIQKSELGTDEYPGCQVKFTIPDHYSFTLPEGK